MPRKPWLHPNNNMTEKMLNGMLNHNTDKQIPQFVKILFIYDTETAFDCFQVSLSDLRERIKKNKIVVSFKILGPVFQIKNAVS